MSWVALVSGKRIEDAIDRGEFDDLPGAGKPLDPDRLRETMEDTLGRMVAQAGGMPEELSLAGQARRARSTLDQIADPVDRRRAMGEIALLEARAGMMAERRRRG